MTGVGQPLAQLAGAIGRVAVHGAGPVLVGEQVGGGLGVTDVARG